MAAGLAEALPAILQSKRWFGGKARRIASTEVVDRITFDRCETRVILLFLMVTYMDGGSETYEVPVAAAFGEEAERIRHIYPQAVLMSITGAESHAAETGCLYDAAWNDSFTLFLLNAIEHGGSFTGKNGDVTVSSTCAFHDLVQPKMPLEPAVMKNEQSNTSVSFGGQVILKLYRRLEEGMNPDLEIGRVLTGMGFQHVPPIAGAIEYRRHSGEQITLALLQQFVRNEGDAWRYSLGAVDRYMRSLADGLYRDEQPPLPESSLLDLARDEYHPAARKLIGLYLDSAERLGQRTAELHVALSQASGDLAFSPEPLNEQYRQARYDRMVRSASETCALLQQRISTLSPKGQAKARRIFDLQPVIHRTYQEFLALNASIQRIRCHGDYHLGQVLCTGQDFMIIDFEGEPARSLEERRMKHPAMVDVAGMVRSFHYAPFAFLREKRSDVAVTDMPKHPATWGQFWSTWTSVAFLKAYLSIVSGSSFWPQDGRAVHLLFAVYLMEKAIYELGYELNNRPEWVEIPLGGLQDIVERFA